MDRPRPRRLAAGLAALALVASLGLPGLTGGQALAHAQLVASSPGAGEVIPDAPGELVLVFSEPLEDAFSSVDLTDAEGATILSGAGEVDPADAFQLLVPLPPLDDGVYSVQWRSLSAADGHTTSGFFTFGIGDTEASLPVGYEDHEHAAADALTGVGRGLSYLGLLAGIGMPIIVAVVLRRRMAARLARVIGALLIVSALAALMLAVRSGIDLAGVGGLPAYLFDSRTGILQVARAVVMGVGGVALIGLAGRSPRATPAMAAGFSLAGIGLLVAAGHAAALPGVAPLAGQVVHVAAVGVWLSGVVTLAVLALRPRLAIDQAGFRDLVPRFSGLALVAIGLAGATGFYASWSQTGVLLDLSTTYGRLLAIKLGLAFGALGLGGLNYLDGGRLLGWLGGFRRRLLAESSLAAAVLVATGLLSATPPLEGVQGVAIEPVPDAFGQVAPGLSLELLPGRPGMNQVAVIVEGTHGGEALELLLDRLDTGEHTRIPLRRLGDAHAMDHGPGMDHDAHEVVPAESEPNRYAADAVILPADSRWDATVRVLSESGDGELWRQRYGFAMGDAQVIEGRVTSLLTLGLAMGALLVVGGGLAVGLALGGARLPRTDPVASRAGLAIGGSLAVGLGILIGLGQLATGIGRLF